MHHERGKAATVLTDGCVIDVKVDFERIVFWLNGHLEGTVLCARHQLTGNIFPCVALGPNTEISFFEHGWKNPSKPPPLIKSSWHWDTNVPPGVTLSGDSKTVSRGQGSPVTTMPIILPGKFVTVKAANPLDKENHHFRVTVNSSEGRNFAIGIVKSKVDTKTDRSISDLSDTCW